MNPNLSEQTTRPTLPVHGADFSARYEVFSKKFLEGNPAIQAARAGTFGKESMTRYLHSLLEIIRCTPAHLSQARDVCSKRGDAKFTAYFKEKVGEEDGHDRWAEEDLRYLDSVGLSCREIEAAPSILKLVTHLEKLSKEDPEVYFFYLTFNEFFLTRVGGEFVQMLVERCGIPMQALTVVSKHLAADIGHTRENLDFARSLTSPEVLERADRMLYSIEQTFWRFGEELVAPTHAH